MLICVIGPPCSGKSALASYLVQEHQFLRVRVGPSPSFLVSSSSAPAASIAFESSAEFLDYATIHWRTNFVTTDLATRVRLMEFLKRPFVAVVDVSAPLLMRYERAKRTTKYADMSLEQFVQLDDDIVYGRPDPSKSTMSDIDELKPIDSAQVLSPPPPPAAAAVLTPHPSPRPSFVAGDYLIDTHQRREPLAPLKALATQTIHNAFTTLEPFHASLDLRAIEESLRPSWDSYFMLLAALASMRSNCMKRRVGAVLVRERRVVSTGYNGTPRGVKNCAHGGCARCNSHSTGFVLPPSQEQSTLSRKEEEEATVENDARQSSQYAMGQGLEECVCLHAEENALLEAGRERVSGGGTTGAILYCNTCPCLRCTVKIVQCGVTEVVYSLSYSMDDASRSVLAEAGIVLRQIELPPWP